MGFGGSIGHAVSKAAKSVKKKTVSAAKKSTGLAVTAAAAYSVGTTGGLSALAVKGSSSPLNTAVKRYGVITGAVEAPVAAGSLAAFTGGLSTPLSNQAVATQQSLLNPQTVGPRLRQASAQFQTAVLDPISQFFHDLLGIFT